MEKLQTSLAAAKQDPFFSLALSHEIAQEICAVIVDEIAVNSVEIGYANKLQELTPLLASKLLYKDIKEVVTLAEVAIDLGDDEVEEKWVAEKEPSIAPIDVWARGVISIKRRVKQAVIYESLQSSALSTKSGDQLSTGSRVSKAAKNANNANKSRTNRPGLSSYQESEECEPEPLVIKTSIEELSRDKIREKMLNLLEKKRRVQEQRDAELKEVANRGSGVDSKLKRATIDKEVKVGQSYIEKLPTITLDPDVEIIATQIDTKKERDREAKEKEKKEVKKKPTEKKEELFVGGVQAIPVSEVIKLNTGVTFKEGGNTRQGPLPSHSTVASNLLHGADTLSLSKTLTRKAYNEMLDTIQTGPPNFDSDIMLPPKTPQKNQPSTPAAAPRPASSASVLVPRPPSAPKTPDMPNFTHAFADTSNLNFSSSLTVPSVPKLSAVEIYNETIVADPSWGSNPAPSSNSSLPRVTPKPNSNFKGRERPFVSPTSTRQHLPPPALGLTTHLPPKEDNGELSTSQNISKVTNAKASLRDERGALLSSQSKINSTNLTKAFLQKL